MKKFQYYDPTSLDDAVEILAFFNGSARITAGGTDLIGQLKNRILPSYPEAVVNIKKIKDLTGLVQTDENIKVGPLTTIKALIRSETIAREAPVLFQAAQLTASPHLRVMGTIGGNICQNIRCWYYRASQNYFYCLRKTEAPPKAICYAVRGDNRYHSIFGPLQKCFAVHPSDLAPALVALQAKLKTTKRTIGINDFFTVGRDRTTILEADEILTEIILPRGDAHARSAFQKFSFRKTIDFPVANCAVRLVFDNKVITSAVVCLNAVYNIPYRAKAAEQYLVGREITETSAEEAGSKAVSEARPLGHNKYMVFIAQDLVKKALLCCG